MTLATDASGCERLISRMNDLQAEFQTRMEHDCLRCQRLSNAVVHWIASAHRNMLGMASGLAEDGSPLEQES
jgi:hypothetical protein